MSELKCYRCGEWPCKCNDHCTIVHGDCLAAMKHLDSDSVDMIFTDPPYGNGNGSGDFLSRRHKIIRDKYTTNNTPIQNDLQQSMRCVVDGMLREAARVLNRDCCCCCCCCCGGGPTPAFAWLAERMDRDGLSFFHSVIWDKRNPGVGWLYRRQHEMIMVAHRTGGRMLWADKNRKQPNIISISKPRTNNHPNEKPLGLVLRFIENHAWPNMLVLDPFAGSGTTLVAAKQLGRRAIGIELEEKYCEIAANRLDAEPMPLFVEAA